MQEGGPLHTALCEADSVVLQRLLEAGEHCINARDGQGCTPLHLAADAGSLQVLGWAWPWQSNACCTCERVGGSLHDCRW